MGQINRKQTFGIIGLNDEKEHVSYCLECLKQGLKSILKSRIYSITDEPIPKEEKDKGRQCHECGQIVPIYEVKKESKLKDFVETSDNQFDQAKTIVGFDNKKRLTPAEKMNKKLKERIEQEKDEDIKRELRKGNEVTIIDMQLQ
jgi:hypothetical protein